MNILTYLKLRLGAEEGATATEYVFLLVFIALAIIVGATALGGAINSGFNDAAGRVSGAVGTGTG